MRTNLRAADELRYAFFRPLLGDTSKLIWRSSPTRIPPVSSGAFQVIPNSLRLILVVADAPNRADRGSNRLSCEILGIHLVLPQFIVDFHLIQKPSSIGFLSHSAPLLADLLLMARSAKLICLAAVRKTLRCWALCTNGLSTGSGLIVLTKNRDNTDYDEHAAWNSG